tara:strand:- start:3371 stop:3940 length:570 start_codon:yes stop_codon:yes gene_type:complete
MVRYHRNKKSVRNGGKYKLTHGGSDDDEYGAAAPPQQTGFTTKASNPQQDAVDRAENNENELNALNQASQGGGAKKMQFFGGNQPKGELKAIEVPQTYDDPSAGTKMGVQEQVTSGQKTINQGHANAEYDNVNDAPAVESNGGGRRMRRKTKGKSKKGKRKTKKVRKSKKSRKSTKSRTRGTRKRRSRK